MKKFASLLLTVVMLATMLCVFAVPASAFTPPPTIPPSAQEISAENNEIHAEGNCVITKTGVMNVNILEVNENSTLTIGTGVIINVKEKFINKGTVTINGAVYITSCKEKTGLQNVAVNCLTGNFYVDNNPVQEEDHNTNENSYNDPKQIGSTLSEGSLTIIVGIAAAVVFGLGGFFLGKIKKKPVLASGENTDEE